MIIFVSFGLDYIYIVYACLSAGLIPILVPTPDTHVNFYTMFPLFEAMHLYGAEAVLIDDTVDSLLNSKNMEHFL